MKLPRAPMKRARIEIIPMIDAIFFLLVFYMITSMAMIPMGSHQVELPKSETAALKPIEKVVISISKQGDFYLDKDKLAGVAYLKPALATRLAANPHLTVVINSDRDAPMSHFVATLDLIKQSNAENVMVATEPQMPGGAR
jgi:biopolymer transport protein ExbD